MRRDGSREMNSLSYAMMAKMTIRSSFSETIDRMSIGMLK
jgi:hypothetical protein